MSSEKENTPIDGLLAKYLSAAANAAEITEALAWINASAENKNYFEGLKEIWDLSKPAEATANTAEAWKKLKTRMNVNEPPVKSSRIIYRRIAAGIALFLVIGSLVYLAMQPGKEPKMKTLAWTLRETPETDTLPDGSRIVINRNSELTYPEFFSGKTREVNLKGESFFEISHDAEHPFIIHTCVLDVKVVGTSFDVNAFPESDSVKVSVQTGKVKCYAGKDSLILLPGEIAVYHKSTGELRKRKEDDPNTASYRNRIFKFHDTRLSDAVKLLNNAYGSNIVIKSDAIRNCGVNGEYDNRSLDFILTIISESSGINIVHTGNTITLDGKGCTR
jgi:ferric-dicitrate binding protein FerR (iron transport regulator)